ncbi:hypothetical protein F5883DRAFT_102368 [Diaporthe sp. PMI_573]|nr:hypothetical protein F5883DRAFT_102368 [Diaporthaceae sp. PMI_573]
MDQSAQSLAPRASAADRIDVVQEQQDSRFERLEKEHTAKQARLKEEYDAQRAQIESQLRDEADNSKSRLKTNIQKIQRALVAIEESVESTITKRVGLQLEKDSLCRKYEVMIKKAAADLHDKVHDLITNVMLDSNGTQAALLETVSTMPCAADASNDHHFFNSRAEMHQMPLGRYLCLEAAHYTRRRYCPQPPRGWPSLRAPALFRHICPHALMVAATLYAHQARLA